MVFNLHGKDQSERKAGTTNMPDLDCEKSAVQRNNQSGKGLNKPNEILSRLLITLAQLQAGNYSQKLKNEIRQLQQPSDKLNLKQKLWRLKIWHWLI